MWQNDAWGYWSPEYGYSQYDSDSWTTASDSSSSGSVASAQTFAGGASVFDGCTGSSQESGAFHEDSWSSWGWGSESWARNVQSSSYSSWENECGRTATAETGVTTVTAGKTLDCSGSDASYEQRSESSWDNSSYYDSFAHNSSQSECADEAFVQAGDERVSAGSQSECDSSTYESQSSAWSGHYSHQESCESRTGVFGPDGFALYLLDAHESWCSGESAETCEGSSYARNDVGAEHDLVGGVFMPLP
jgi:hypothetical protein